VAAVHVVPPSVLAAKAAVLWPVPSATLATQVRLVEQETSKIDAV
jgi:hypothetical protein